MLTEKSTQMVERGLVELSVNGEVRSVLIRPADILLHTLRDQLGLTGAKPSCLNGDCGACTVLIDGRPIKSCLMLTVEAVSHEITTIEGLRDTDIQKAFVENFSFQCGYCTSGFLLNCYALSKLHPDCSEEVMREWLQSNLCRCTGYQEIQDAVRAVLRREKRKYVE
jgi:aerobic-type carbon monoxide dehydrogenase small subunit (CoxS/CutS family)